MYDITLIFPHSPFLINDAVMPPLGILYLSAQLKLEGYDVQCLDLGLGHKKEEADSDIIGISFTTPQRFEAYELARWFRSKGKVVIAGGPHPTHMPEECLKNGFNCVVRGEAEEIIVNIVENIKRKQFKTVYISCETGANHIVFPDRLALDVKKYSYTIGNRAATVILTSRSCPFHCSFCSKISSTFRMQSADRTVEEIFYLAETFDYSAFMIFDDVFIADKKRLETIVNMVKYDDFLFRCFGRANLLTREVCFLLKTMGVIEVGIGIESGSNEILQHNLKGTTRKLNTAAVLNLRQAGIRAKAFLIVGLPGETEETVKETKSWIEEAKPDDIDVSILQPMPGSLLFNDPKRFGLTFTYNDDPLWYKGKPGEYKSSCSTKELSAQRLIELRNELEDIYKDKKLLK